MSTLRRFIGGSPVEVLIKLLILSLIVGIVLSALNIDPLDIVEGVQKLILKIYALGWDSIEWLLRYLMVGAIIVVPIWLILRVLNFTRRG